MPPPYVFDQPVSPPEQFGFFLHLIIVFKITIASQVCTDTDDQSNRSFVLGDTMCLNNNHWSTIVLATIWTILHVTMFISTKLPTLVTKHVRLAQLPTR